MIPNKAVSCLSTPQRQGHSHPQNTQPPLSKNKTNKQKICPPLKGHYFINDGSTAYELPLPGDKNQVVGVEIRQILSSGLAELHTQELVSNSQKGKKIILSPAFLHWDNSQSATSPSSLALPQATIQACRKVQLCRITYSSQNCSLVSRPVLEVPPAEHGHANRQGT